MNLSGTQLKDTYGNLVTTGTSAGSPTEGGLQNGDGQLLTQVGIGTNSPSHILDIESANSPQLRITDTTNDVAFKVYAQDADVFMGTHSNHALRIATNNDEKLRIEADGDIAFYDDANNQGLFWDASEAFLGIGTVPATPLHVNATNANACIINVTGTSPNYIFDIRDDNVSQFRVDNSGSVGIGTTSPANDVSGLHIAVASSSDQLYLERTSSATGRYYLGTASNSFFIVDDAQSAERLRIDSSGNVGIGGTPTTVLDVFSSGSALRLNSPDANGSYATFSNNGTPKGYIGSAYHILSSPSNDANDLAIRAQGNLLFASGGSTERLRIDSSGNVGIGTDNPDRNLHIETSGDSYVRVSGNRGNSNDLHIGNIEFENSFGSAGVIAEMRAITGNSGTQSTKGQLAFYTDDGSTYAERLRINSSGNVGINTDSPSGKLEIYSSTLNNQLYLVSVDTGQSAINFGGTSAKTKGRISYSDNSDLMYFFTDSQERLRIDSSGNLNMSAGGGNIILDSGAGIDFSATADGSGTMTSELLDDYEEGTWTPVLRGASVAGTYEFATSGAYYTKVGRMVTVTANLVLSASITGGGSAYAKITGLPYAKGANMAPQGTVLFRDVDFADDADYVTVEFVTSSASSELYFPAVRDNAGKVDTDISGFGNSSTINLSITYFT